MRSLRTWDTDKVIGKGKPTDLWVKYDDATEIIFEREREMSLMFSPEDMKKMIAERNRALQDNFVYARALRNIAEYAGVPFKSGMLGERYWERFMQAIKQALIRRK